MMMGDVGIVPNRQHGFVVVITWGCGCQGDGTRHHRGELHGAAYVGAGLCVRVSIPRHDSLGNSPVRCPYPVSRANQTNQSVR